MACRSSIHRRGARPRSLVPGLDTQGAVAFAWEETPATATAYGTTVAFAAAARERGVEIHQNTAATGIVLDTGSRVAGVVTPKGNDRDAHRGRRRRPLGRPGGTDGGRRRPAQARADRGGGHPRARGRVVPRETPSVYDFVNGLSYPSGGDGQVMAEGNSYYKGPLDPDG